MIKTKGTFSINDNYYDIVGFNEKSQKIILEKKAQHSIYWYDYTITQITRKLSKTKTIKVEGFKYDLSEVQGL